MPSSPQSVVVCNCLSFIDTYIGTYGSWDTNNIGAFIDPARDHHPVDLVALMAAMMMMMMPSL
jgi:hypothetical protein